MAETITIYAGSKKAGLLKKRALEKEARRWGGPRASVSDFFWTLAKKHGSEKLKLDLEAADLADQK